MSHKILMVDDDPSSLLLAEKVLMNAGYQVQTATGGYAALELIKNEKFDIIYTDLVMTGMNGETLCEEAKKISPETEVIVVSGYPLAIAKKLQLFIQYGGKDKLLRKPLNVEKLLKVTEELLQPKEA